MTNGDAYGRVLLGQQPLYAIVNALRNRITILSETVGLAASCGCGQKDASAAWKSLCKETLELLSQ